MKHTQEKLTELFAYAVDLFNETMDEEYAVGESGIMLRFFTPDNGIQVYEDFCSIYGYISALKAPVRCFGNHLSGKRKSWFRTDNECGGAAILKTRTSRMGTPVGC